VYSVGNIAVRIADAILSLTIAASTSSALFSLNLSILRGDFHSTITPTSARLNGPLAKRLPASSILRSAWAVVPPLYGVRRYFSASSGIRPGSY